MAIPSASFPIETNGKALVDSKGNRFMIQGVCLTSNFLVNGTLDLLSDANLRYMTDIILPQLQYLNVNMVRVYKVDLTQTSRSRVMNLLAQNGIGVMVELVTSEISINRVDPVYSLALYQQGAAVIDQFQQFPNTMLFSVGNEVVFPGVIYHHFLHAWQNANPDQQPTQAQLDSIATQTNACEQKCAAVMKSFIRDMKAYMTAKNYRAIPVGMAMQDGPQSTVDPPAFPPGIIGTDVVAEFYACGDAGLRADYIGINTYRYINSQGGSPWEDVPGSMGSYDGLANELLKLPIPVILTESIGLNFPDGANNPPYIRDWAIVDQMYTETLLYKNLSGQIAFELLENTTTNDFFGLYHQPTNLSALFATSYGGSDYLSEQFAKFPARPLPMPRSVANPSACPPACSPALLPCPALNITVTVENYATMKLAVVQNGTTLAYLPAAKSSSNPSSTTPSSTQVKVSDQLELYILEPSGSWAMVCSVVAAKLTDGALIKNNVPWGSACNIR